MVFGFLRRKKKPSARTDPLAAYDGLLEDLERQGREVRRSAATLLALRGQLARGEEQQRSRLAQLRERIADAVAHGDVRSQITLERDAAHIEQQLASTTESLARASVDGELLLEAAGELSRQLQELQAERTTAQARLTSGLAVSQTLLQRTARVDKVLALDAARDEVERAHALAEIYREDTGDR